MVWWLLWVLPFPIYSSGVPHTTVTHQKQNEGPIPIWCHEEADCGEPLFLTPMMKKDRIHEAQQAAKVTFPNSSEFQQVLHVQSYSGFFTVNEKFDSNIFFWFFLAEDKPQNAPVLLWLEGGPGGASTIDAFDELIGPFLVDDNLQLTLGSNRWTQSINVLYIDNPVGAGFSFTRNNAGYATTQADYTNNLYGAVLQFFQLFPDFRANEFFIAGESYGGKYVPALAYRIHQENTSTLGKINLKGIALCSGMVNPQVQIGYSELLYDISVIDFATKHKFAQIESYIKQLIEKEQYTDASQELDRYMSLDPNETDGAFHGVTSLYVNSYMYPTYGKETTSDIYFKNAINFVKTPALLKSIHVGQLDFWLVNGQCYFDLIDDLTRSVVPQLEVLMDNYLVLVYNGQLEIMCSYLLMIEAVMKLKWKGADEYKHATRHQWWVDGELAGYAKSAGNFTEILVRNASHGCTEQPSWIWDLMRRFTLHLPLELK